MAILVSTWWCQHVVHQRDLLKCLAVVMGGCSEAKFAVQTGFVASSMADCMCSRPRNHSSSGIGAVDFQNLDDIVYFACDTSHRLARFSAVSLDVQADC